ncbi:competence protein CoiA family protein [Arthrobacter sp. NA-172]|uniref:competence protein CoiA family protein n=1 Tax=Arthrobacter sp. NA-172 TaxID=3367524 RepID=UPI003754017B
MIEIRRLFPRKWEPSDPLVAYNNADGKVVLAAAMHRGNNSYYDRYGYKGSKEIVCIDCKEDGREVPVQLVDAKTRCKHFRHQAGEAPDGLRRHGETAEHLYGKRCIMDWARDQHHILPWSVEDEVWIPSVRLRSDVRATTTSGRHLAFEVQRKPMETKEWDRRHGGYETAGIRDVWLWSPDVPDLALDLPLTSVVLDTEYGSLGVFVAMYSGSYRHPTAERYLVPPTHYASAPLSEWSLSNEGSLVPPPGMSEFIADKPELARLAQLKAHREARAGRPLTSRPTTAVERRTDALRQYRSRTSYSHVLGASASAPYIDPERDAQREAEAIERIMGRKR